MNGCGRVRNSAVNEKDVEITEYADELISVPRARLLLELTQVESGVTLAHEGKLLVSCRLTREGMAASGFMAQALGAPLPALGRRWRRGLRRRCCSGR